MGDVQNWSATDSSNTDLFPEGMAFSAVNDGGRAVQGAIARWFRDINGSLAASGSSNAFTLTSNRTISSLADGTRMSFRANHSITGAATLNLNGLGAKDIKRFNGSSLATGDIISGQIVDVVYSLSLDDWIMVSALAALVGSMFADFGENGSPGNPAADNARFYAKDDSGTTLMAYRDSGGTERELLGRATQAQMEAATDTRQGVSAGRMHFHPAMPKAAGRGASAGGIVGTAYNVASISKDGSNIYTVTFTTPMSNTNYWVVGSAVVSGVSEIRDFNWEVIDASSFRCAMHNEGDTETAADFGFAVYGDM